MATFATYGSLEEMLKHMAEQRAAADAATEPWQAALMPGDYFLREVDNGLIIYGQVLDPSKPADEGDYSPETLKEIEEDAAIYDQPHMVGYRFSRCFSAACMEGELGDTHVATVARTLTREQFERARELGWPFDLGAIRDILAMHPRLTKP